MAQVAASGRVAELEAAFRGRIRGRLLTDRIGRQLYATDASPFKILPSAVLVPETDEDVHAAIEVCRELEVPITARGAGTSLSGQCVGDGLALDCSHLRQIHWIDPERRLARVEPGVTWWRLNAEARKHGLEFGPDPATKRQCTIGGMVATNAGGTHSIVYGASVDHVHAVDAILPDGRSVRFEGSADSTLAAAGAPGDLASSLEAVRAAATPLLGPSFRDLARRCSGYQLEHLCSERPDLAKVLAGSDGTLAMMTAVEVELDPLPAVRVLAVVGFDDLHAAVAAVPELVQTDPCAVELVSKSMLDWARADPLLAAKVVGVDPDAGALLFVEYQGDGLTEATAGFDRMDRVLRGTTGVRQAARYIEPLDCAAMWSCREAGVGALSSVASGPRLPQAFVEDTIVAVDRLPGYARELDALFARHEMQVVWYGHASTGLLHVRPFLDLTDQRDLIRIESMMGDVVDLVRAWEGDLCGEHGDGLARTYFNERLFGSELYAQMRAVKAAFDPTNLLNPGKVVEGPKVTESLRYGPAYRRRELDVRIAFDDVGDFATAVESCFGAGVCRKRDIGTMCPPAAATGLEEHSTRARANLLRSVVSGDLSLEDLSADESHEVMDTCVMCKACKTECPARVDMARLKTAWADLVRRTDGPSRIQRVIAGLRPLLAAGTFAAPLTNATMGSKTLKRILGIAPERRLPSVASRPLTRRLPQGRGDVALYPDCFTTYQEPRVGEALGDILGAAGIQLGLAKAGCCGRTMLSEGYIDRAREAARKSAAVLRRTPTTILFCEPSCLSAVTDDWPHLIGDVSDIAQRCRPAEDLLPELAHRLSFRGGGRVLLHGHCHQKALWGTAGTEAALRIVPDLDVEVLDAGCCGMAGGFGYRADRYELSVAMAERVLIPAVRSAPDADVVATGTSCRHQVADLAHREAVHPLEFLRDRLQA